MMLKKYANKILLLLSFLGYVFLNNNAKSQLVIADQGATAQTLINGFIGSGLTISNATITCPSVAYGTFSGGGAMGVTNGVVLTTGTAANLSNNGSTQMSTSHGTTCNDPQLTGLESLATNDCCILEFDVVPSCTELTIRFVFGSEEYPEFVGGGFNDAFGFFVTGSNPGGGNYTNQNIAIVTGTTICSIDNVNDGDNSGFYVDNSTGTGIVFDGYTTAISSALNVVPCQSYHFKLAIADAGDGGWDSGVFIEFLQCTNELITSVSSTTASCGVSDGTATVTASGNLGALTYVWTPAPGGGQGTATATGLTGGTTYEVIVDDAYACIDPDTLSVTIASAVGTPSVTNAPLTQSICSGGSTSLVNLTADIVGTTFVWTATASPGVTGFTANGTSTIPVQTLLNSGGSAGTVTYAITPTAGGCQGPVVDYVITVDAQIVPTFDAVPNVCQNDTPPVLPISSTNTPAISGSWSPAVSTASLGTTTYTFTPDLGQCATTTTLDIIVSTPVTPTFTAVPNVCQNDVAPVLPTSSLETPAITGLWSPVVSTATIGTTTYTFTPAAGVCAVTTTTTITVDAPITPTFAAVPNVCQNDVVPVLPTSSTNTPVITGQWSPLVSTATTGTTTYTFTPDANQCATTTTNTITVDTPITPTFSAIPNVCQGDVAPVLPTSSTDSPAITGIWSPMVSTAAAGTTTYTFTPDAGQCATITTLDITVDSPVVPSFSAVSDVCLNSPAPSLPTSSTNTPAVTGNWDPLVTTTAIGTTTYTFTPSAGECATTTTTTITVVSQITPTFTQIASMCAGSTPPALPTVSTNTPGMTGVWSPTTISTATAGTQTYTFTPDPNQCGGTTTMNITINAPVIPTFVAVADVCQNSQAPILPTSSTNTPAITGGWLPLVSTATPGTTTYTFTPGAGQCATTATNTITVDPQVTPTFTAIPNICQNSAAPLLPTSSTNVPAITGIWSSAINTSVAGSTTYIFTPTAGQCAGITTLTVTVDPQIIPTFAAIPDVCQNEAAPVLPLTSTNAISGGWSPSVNTSLVGTVTYTFTPTAGACATTATNTITVNPQVTPLFGPINPICVGEIAPSLPPSSFDTPSITGVWSPAVVSNVSTGSYTFTPTAGQCATTTTLTVTVNPAPILSISDPDPVCEPFTIDLTDSTITAGSIGGTISYFSNSACTVPVLLPTSIGTSGVFFVRSMSSDGCPTVLPVTVVIHPLPIAAFIPDPAVLTTYDLTSVMQNNSIDAATYEWYFMDGAESNDVEPTHTFPDSLYGEQLIILIATSSEGCKDTTSKIVTINEELIFYIPNSFTPDGDKHNQNFQPVFTSGYEPYDFSMIIFDRWGEIIFETYDASKGWEGTLGENGELVQDGIHTWKIEFKLKESDKRMLHTGHVSVLR